MHIAIIGAGIVGASCAYYLSQRGAKVTVLERNPGPAMGSTAKSAAGIRHQFSHPENIRMSLYSARMFANFKDLTGEEASYRKVGYLFLLSETMLSNWQKQQELQRSLGAHIEALSLDETLKRFPYLHGDGLAGSSFGPDDGILDPHGITLGFLNTAKRKGAKVKLDTEVFGLKPLASGWQLKTQTETLEFDAVLNASGAFGSELGKRAGLDIPVLPYRRNVYTTEPVKNFPHPSPLIIDMTTGVYLRSEGERLIFGLSNLDEPAGDNQAVDWNWLEHTLELALPRFPFLETVGLDRRACWAGLYEITPDHLPILGKMPGVDHFYNACGFSGHGVQHSAATGLILAEEILDGYSHTFDISDFRYERLANQDLKHEANIV